MNIAKSRDNADQGGDASLAFEDSVGFQIRQTHRLLQKYLQMQIEPYGLSVGTWYLLRVLWEEDGLTQRELSARVGTMEPTTLVAIKSMIASGLVERKRNRDDGRKLNVFLTEKGRALKAACVPKAKEVNAAAAHGMSDAEIAKLLRMLNRIQDNIDACIASDSDPA